LSDPRAAARAVDALRRGWPVAIGGQALLAVETGDAERLRAFDPKGTAPLLLSAGRAATLKLTNQRDAAAPDGPVLIERVPWLDFDTATALADPQLDLATPLKGPFRAAAIPDVDAAAAALRLARIAGVLPAFFMRPAAGEDAITPADIDAHEDADRLRIVARAHLPVAGAENAEIVAFRTDEMPGEHVALLIGQPSGEPPLVRLHSECLTGDVLGSLKCDCGPQLQAAIREIEAAGWGILLYLRQEGRGIGLGNKVRAYDLQNRGADTVEANLALGFEADARNYDIAGAILRDLGVQSVRLLTNNPLKIKGLEDAGVVVASRVAHWVGENQHNASYLAVKRRKMGHHGDVETGLPAVLKAGSKH
jgi:GTP cyclohydrolase II